MSLCKEQITPSFRAKNLELFRFLDSLNGVTQELIWDVFSKWNPLPGKPYNGLGWELEDQERAAIVELENGWSAELAVAKVIVKKRKDFS